MRVTHAFCLLLLHDDSSDSVCWQLRPRVMLEIKISDAFLDTFSELKLP